MSDDSVGEQRIRWLEMKKDGFCEAFREKLRQGLGGCEELYDDWITGTATVIRETGRRCLVCQLDRRQMIRRLGGGTRKYRRVFRGRV